MKGIVLAGGAGTRLYPSTLAISKQLLPVYDKPMIYHPVSVLMLAGIKDILIISTPQDLPGFKKLMGTGETFGVKFSYIEQPSPDGLAQAFILGKDFIGSDCCALILGDNIFYGPSFSNMLQKAVKRTEKEGGATLFAYQVKDPQRFGVVEFDNNNHVISIEEKPQNPKSQFAVTGLYFYDNKVVDYVKNQKPSARNELEITDLNRLYLEQGKLKAQILGRGFAWLDTGTMESLMEASTFVQTLQNRQGLVISAPEEIAYHEKWINKEQLLESAKIYGKSPYGEHLRLVAEDRLVF